MSGGWVYIMTNRPNGILYTGVTSDIGRRAYEHRDEPHQRRTLFAARNRRGALRRRILRANLSAQGILHVLPLPRRRSSQALFRRDDDSGLVALTLTTPQNRNALSLETIEALIAAFGEIAADKRRAPWRSPAKVPRSAPATISRRCRRIATIPIAGRLTTSG